MDERALDQVRLLVRLLPAVAQEDCFALKGGTAINLFVRNLPRLSVDIDLVYLPIQERAESLRSIDAAMRSIAARVSTTPGLRPHVGFGILQSEQIATKLFVRDAGAQVKVETTPVQRGCVYEPATRAVSPTVEERFGLATARVASFPDLYAGKIVAALDRQHPRDLFDVHHLLSGEGIDEPLRTAAVVYLLSHGRPLLAPTPRDLAVEYERGLAGLGADPITVRTLEETRERLVSDLVGRMPEKHRRFLVSFEKGEPEWGLLDVPHAKDLPAVHWRILKMSRQDATQQPNCRRRRHHGSPLNDNRTSLRPSVPTAGESRWQSRPGDGARFGAALTSEVSRFATHNAARSSTLTPPSGSGVRLRLREPFESGFSC